MEIITNEIIKIASQIIENKGLENLTIHNLASELKISETQLYNQFTKDDDILLMILLFFENEIKESILEFKKIEESPEKELKFLFKRLYVLFMEKPYYLSIIFDKSLMNRDESINMAISRIKEIVENYFTTLINKGKLENIFKTQVPTKSLVDKMLSEFKLLMEDEQYVNDMILDLKTLKKSKD
ncbi:MAG: hypothetical protein RBT49_01585 [Bacteroidales bacterium]|jgi:AcrR family transcriptional regulator|nr:hypothetical protein [Bacteroidales bacterium]